jgi:hypothetical protein
MRSLAASEAARLFQKGLEQFNRGKFFEAHESWEVLWLAAAEPDKTFLQGIIQVAAALHHYRHDNLAGARSLLRRGLAKIEQFAADYRGVRLEPLRVTVRAWQQFIQGAKPKRPPLPKIRRAGS